MAEVGVKSLSTVTYLAEGGAIGANLIVVAGTANNQCALPGAAEALKQLGVTVTAAAAAGDPIQVCELGRADLKVNANGAAIAVGDMVSSDGTTGRGQVATLTNTKSVIGRALQASSADGDLIAVFVLPYNLPAS